MGFFERNLNKYGQLIDIQTRTDAGATFGKSNPEQIFVTKHAGVKALVITPKGKATFDDVGLDENPTHKICFNWIDGVSQEDWLLIKGKRYDILSDLNCCERDERLELFCRVRGEGEAAKG